MPSGVIEKRTSKMDLFTGSVSSVIEGRAGSALESVAPSPANYHKNHVDTDSDLTDHEPDHAHNLKPLTSASKQNGAASKDSSGLRQRNNAADSGKLSESDQKTALELKREERAKKKRKVTHYSHTFIIHTVQRPSPLSKESPEQNYRGFFNLSMLVLFVSNLRLIIENYMKYGLLLYLPSIPAADVAIVVFALALVPLFVYIAYRIEKLAVREITTTKPTADFVWRAHITNIVFSLVIPTTISWFLIKSPLAAAIPLFPATVIFLKLISYALVNSDLRRELALKVFPRRYEDTTSREGQAARAKQDERIEQKKDEDKEDEKPPRVNLSDPPYPLNITLNNLAYFCFAPTLSYQPSYPTTPKFRTDFFLKRAVEFSVAILGMYILGAQYAAPTLHNSLQALEQGNLVKIMERLLKLSVISVVMWLLMFYAVFHSGMNMVAEVLRFGDRRFYEPWWNCSDIATYWRLWNTPVYNWGKRHIYLPLIINFKVHPTVASLVVFTISALLHELLVGIPVHSVKGWAFWGMMGQIPLIAFTKWLESLRERRFGDSKEFFDTIGNLIFWISFTIVGQPMCIMLYYFDWYQKNAPKN
ncbi:MBOAT, membrane-bound O-acyltransferase family-domain-containing protein [Cladochytrium replicatum]|nr:MBOAT, membrane-bound O-acyltransferase family-domain-containing protein [Cladochytrium replicatum]